MGIMEDVEGHERDDEMGETGMHGDGQEKIEKRAQKWVKMFKKQCIMTEILFAIYRR